MRLLSSVLSFLRKDGDSYIVVVLNFTPVPYHDYCVGVPASGNYTELLNSDSSYYDGTDVGNKGQIVSTPESCNGRPHSLRLTLPPLGGVLLRLE